MCAVCRGGNLIPVSHSISHQNQIAGVLVAGTEILLQCADCGMVHAGDPEAVLPGIQAAWRRDPASVPPLDARAFMRALNRACVGVEALCAHGDEGAGQVYAQRALQAANLARKDDR